MKERSPSSGFHKLSLSLSLGSAALLGLDATASKAQKPTSAVGSMTDAAQLTAAGHTGKTMQGREHAPARTLYLNLKVPLSLGNYLWHTSDMSKGTLGNPCHYLSKMLLLCLFRHNSSFIGT